MAVNGRSILTRDATIKTAAVEVKALTISGKQVTLAVFRQLKNESLLDERTAELQGIPWGTVNYFFGGCGANHLHVVWQKGGELRRSCVYPEVERHKGWNFGLGRIEEMVPFFYAASALENTWHESFSRMARNYDLPPREKFNIKAPIKLEWYVIKNAPLLGWSFFPQVPPCVRDFIYWRRGGSTNWSKVPSEVQERETKLQEEIHQFLCDGGFGTTTWDIMKQANGEYDGMREFHKKWSRHYAELLQLDQLFIAV